MSNYIKISDDQRVALANLNWGYQIIDRQENTVIAAITDEELQGPRRSPATTEYAETLFEFYKDKPQPFRRRQLAYHKETGKRVRILDCKPNRYRDSGWAVNVTLVTRGRIGGNPRIDFRGVDSSLFSISVDGIDHA